MTVTEENQNEEAPYGYTIDQATGQLRPKKRAGRTRTVPVTDETDPAAHREAQLARQRDQRDRFYAAHPDYKATYDAAWRAANPDKFSEYNKKSNLKLKRQVIDAYGGECACCGETVLVFLTIDHVDGDGAEHRREMAAECNGNKYSQAGARTYRWLRDHDFPPGFQVLCMNCNCGKQWNNGVCPHKESKTPILFSDGRLRASDLG
jgi:hypothetical protein